jgi:hypothetical protein
MTNPMLMDPDMESAMRRQLYAQSLMSQGMQTDPVRSPWQAAARALSGALYFESSAEQQMQQYADASRRAYAGLLGQMFPSGPPRMPGQTAPTTGAAAPPLQPAGTWSEPARSGAPEGWRPEAPRRLGARQVLPASSPPVASAPPASPARRRTRASAAGLPRISLQQQKFIAQRAFSSGARHCVPHGLGYLTLRLVPPGHCLGRVVATG